MERRYRKANFFNFIARNRLIGYTPFSDRRSEKGVQPIDRGRGVV